MEIEKIYYLVLLPVGAAFLYLLFYLDKQYEKKLKLWGDVKILKDLTIGLKPQKYFSLFLPMALLSIIIAFTNPRWGIEEENLISKGSDVYLAIDISKSMDANDVSPSRMLKTRNYVADLINSLKGNNIGLILFAGSAFLQMPLTNDYAAVRMMTSTISTDFAGDQGTNLSEVGTIVKRANQKTGSKSNNLIIITDGEDHENEGLADLKEVASSGTTIYCIGVGTEEGGFIPTTNGYKKDENGQPVKTKLNIALINEIAKTGNGKAFNIEDQNSIATIVKDINGGSKSIKTGKSYASYRSTFPYFLALGLLFLLADLVMSNRHLFPFLNKKSNP